MSRRLRRTACRLIARAGLGHPLLRMHTRRLSRTRLVPPLPGGLQWYPTLNLLEKVFRARRVVGFDVVELCPQEGNVVSDVLAASLVYKMMGMMK